MEESVSMFPLLKQTWHTTKAIWQKACIIHVSADLPTLHYKKNLSLFFIFCACVPGVTKPDMSDTSSKAARLSRLLGRDILYTTVSLPLCLCLSLTVFPRCQTC